MFSSPDGMTVYLCIYYYFVNWVEVANIQRLCSPLQSWVNAIRLSPFSSLKPCCLFSKILVWVRGEVKPDFYLSSNSSLKCHSSYGDGENKKYSSFVWFETPSMMCFLTGFGSWLIKVAQTSFSEATSSSPSSEKFQDPMGSRVVCLFVCLFFENIAWRWRDFSPCSLLNMLSLYVSAWLKPPPCLCFLTISQSVDHAFVFPSWFLPQLCGVFVLDWSAFNPQLHHHQWVIQCIYLISAAYD